VTGARGVPFKIGTMNGMELTGPAAQQPVAVGQETALSHAPPPVTGAGAAGVPLVMVVTASAMSAVS
jgi:hypothetical protein